MSRPRLVVGIVAAVALAAGAAYWLRQPTVAASSAWQGYVEGNLVFIAPEDGGRIENLEVLGGERVEVGQLLFALDASMQSAQRDEAAARLTQARASLANLRAAQQRPEQIAVLQAQEARARASLDLSESEYERQQALFQRGIAAKARLDQTEATLERDKAALVETQRQIDAARLAGRAFEIDGAEAAVRIAEAALAQAETRLAKRRVTAPAAARVEDIYFRPGEVVNAGQPVLALLPPTNLRFRFYVPEPQISALALGGTIAIACDNCGEGIVARLTFISQQAEFTPPVIFSDQERAKLVFRAEATPSGDVTLPIGLPIQVRLADTGP